jgi:hypothetical protein
LFFRVFGLDALRSSGLPGLGITIFVFSLFAAVFLVLGQRTHLTPGGCALCLAALALSLTFALFDNASLRILNCFVVLAVGAMGIFRISGLAEKSLRQAAVLWETAALSLTALFRHVDKPFRALGSFTSGGKSAYLVSSWACSSPCRCCAPYSCCSHRRTRCFAVCSGAWAIGWPALVRPASSGVFCAHC